MNTKSSTPARTSLLTLLIVALCPYVTSADESLQSYGIEAQPMSEALKEFAAQTEIQVAFSPDAVDGLIAQSVEGDYVPAIALQILLDESGLDYEFASEKLVVVRAPRAVKDERGNSNPKNSTLQPVLMAQTQTEAIRTNQSSTGSDGHEDEEGDAGTFQLDEIIVTGTNIRGAENPTTLVLQFDREAIDLSGAATIEEFLRALPQNFGSESQLTADSVNPNDSGRNQVQGTFVDLRGLGAGSTLTLLNGRRMTAAGSGNAVDISVLPLGAIERVDVLLDGASAIYGSDAVGGAVNFVTRKNYEGFEVDGQFGTVTNGSKEHWRVGAAGGVAWDSGGVFVGGSVFDQTPLKSSERDFIDQSLVNDGATLGRGSERFSVATSVYQSIVPKLTFAADALYSEVASEASQNIVFGSAERRTARSDQQALFLNSRFEITLDDDLTALLFLDYGRNEVDNTDSDTAFSAIENRDNELSVVELRLGGKLLAIGGGDVTFSAGALHRSEDFQQSVTGGNVVFDVNGKRQISALYAETLIPFVGPENELPFLQRLEVSLAGRYEDYNDFGNTIDPKIGVLWQFTSEFSLRAAYSESFRAPDLQAVNQRQVFSVSPFPTSLFTSVEPPEPDDRILLPNFVLALTPGGGNPDLGPETADTWSVGFAYEPRFLDGFSLQVNYFSIEYQDRLERIDNFDTVGIPAFRDLVSIPPDLSEVQEIFAEANAGSIDLILPPSLLVPFDVGPGDIAVLFRSNFQNVSERQVSGLDVGLQFEKSTGVGLFSTSFNMQYQLDYNNRISESAESVDQLNILYRPIDLRFRGIASWVNEGFTTLVAVNYTDGYRDAFDESLSMPIGSWTTVDASISYDAGALLETVLAENARVSLSVRNLFDEDPPFVETGFGLNFDSANADPFGRSVSLSVSKTF